MSQKAIKFHLPEATALSNNAISITSLTRLSICRYIQRNSLHFFRSFTCSYMFPCRLDYIIIPNKWDISHFHSLECTPSQDSRCTFLESLAVHLGLAQDCLQHYLVRVSLNSRDYSMKITLQRAGKFSLIIAEITRR